MNNKNNKKNKKQRGGFINMNDPVTMGIIISLVVVVCVVCIYGGLVYFGGMDINPMNWFNSEPNSEPNLETISETRMLRTDSDPPNINMGTAEENFKPMPNPGNNIEVFKGGRKLFRRRR